MMALDVMRVVMMMLAVAVVVAGELMTV